jgi:hypothetical protein
VTESSKPLVLSRHLRIGGVKVLSIQAAVDSEADGDIEVEWSTRADEVSDKVIFVLGQLHTTGMQARSDISVVAYCHLADDFDGEITDEVLRAAAQEGSVPHVLYDIAAACSQQMIGMVQMKGALPRTTPKSEWIDYSEQEAELDDEE